MVVLTILVALSGIGGFVLALYGTALNRQVSIEFVPWIFHKGRPDVKAHGGGAVEIVTDSDQSYLDIKLTNTGKKPLRKFKVQIYEPGWTFPKKVYGSFDSQFDTVDPNKTKHVFVYVSDGQVPYSKVSASMARIKIKVGRLTFRSKKFPFNEVPGQS